MNACPDLLAALLQRRRDLELDATAVKSRLAEINDLIDMLERPQRKRTRRPDAERSQHVPGGAHQPEQPTDELFPADGQDTTGGTQ